MGLNVGSGATIVPKESVPKGPFFIRPASIHAQTVLYNTPVVDLRRALASLWRTTELMIADGVCSGLTVRYGDSSSSPCLSPETLDALRREFPAPLVIEYDFFNANLGSAGGQNRLAAAASADFIFILNPDVVVSPRAIEFLLEPFKRPDVGMTEAKQLPIEHPKDFDLSTGDTVWTSGACSMVPRALFHAVGGYDAKTFFLYCDDVDLAWRVRHAGFRLIHQPAAVVFHDKRLDDDGGWRPGAAERYYSAEAALLLAHKWSRPDIVKRILRVYDAHGDEHERKAAEEYRRRAAAGGLPTPVPGGKQTSRFVGDAYAKHRYVV